MTLAVDTENLHPSSETCLMALQWLQQRLECRKILDLGCGNGMLSIVAAHLWGAEILAADIIPKAVADATAAVAAHALENRIRVVRSDGFSNPELAVSGPYDLIIANLLPQLLVRMAIDIKKSLKPDGYLVMAGIQAWQAAETEKAYGDLGFEILEQFSISPWKAYILRAVS